MRFVHSENRSISVRNPFNLLNTLLSNYSRNITLQTSPNASLI
jgi:hypothetical protein